MTAHLKELDAGGQVREVELVGHIPADGSKLAPLLHHAMQEGLQVQQLAPFAAIHRIQHVLHEESGDMRPSSNRDPGTLPYIHSRENVLSFMRVCNEVTLVNSRTLHNCHACREVELTLWNKVSHLRDPLVGCTQAGFHANWSLVGGFDAHLEQANGEGGVRLSRDPQPETFMHRVQLVQRAL